MSRNPMARYNEFTYIDLLTIKMHVFCVFLKHSNTFCVSPITFTVWVRSAHDAESVMGAPKIGECVEIMDT